MIRYEVDAPRATISIDDPERRNPLSNETMLELAEAVHEAALDDTVRVIVVTGTGDRAFSAGGDLSGGFVDRPLEDHAARGALGVLLAELRAAGKPTVARVNGDALAGGFGLVAACDLGVAVEDARFGMPEVAVGLWPMMITAVLVRTIPSKAALELMLTGRLIDAAEAQRLGVVNRVVPRSELDEAVDTLVATLASRSGATVRLGRSAFYNARDLDYDAALEFLHAGLTATAMTDDAREGVEAFLGKRDPAWRHR